MKNETLLQQYYPFVTFLSKVMGRNCEVVLHDLSRPESSVIAIENGHITGHKIGDAPTNLVLKVLQEKTYLTRDFIANYKAVNKDGKVFRSSSFFIKNDKKELVGILCVNADVAHYAKVKEMMDQFLSFSDEMVNLEAKQAEEETLAFEQLHGKVEDVLSTIIIQTMETFDVPPERLSAKEKMNVVRDLHDQGTFLLKDRVCEVAKMLKTSEPTIYRYLQKIKDENN
ncbi:helix-turn-helix transcriptional regulator [Bacillus pseudomycoides]|uniref:helix-turn-helix transcriptional regulator n=1 Tax=Bacillus pseudomycoides TaxID=64104 RepID=UPI000BFA0AB3|nr:PAS domain-containing protein [Bacillus pseudomycoides]PEP52841.1 histidine kinase [Bacillus pseudomycoides]PHC91958.1 histidine kinase [Bacillus pseudomycoides]